MVPAAIAAGAVAVLLTGAFIGLRLARPQAIKGIAQEKTATPRVKPSVPPPAIQEPTPMPLPTKEAAARKLPAPPTAEELTGALAAVPEVGLDRPLDDPLMQRLLRNDRERTGGQRQFHPFALAMDDVHSLPLRMGADCELPRASAEILQHRSRRLREHLSYCGGGADQVRGRLIADTGGMWRTPAAVPTLVQMLQVESTSFRMLLVEWLSRTEGPEAGRALAGRAIFDVDAKVRDAALSALRSRPWSEYRDMLLDALRHPLPATADFAAQALVKLKARSVVPVLAEMLDAPNPAAPFELKDNGSSTYHVRELVRINHLKNCVVCHAVSHDEKHLVRAAPPDPQQPLPPAFTPAYYRGGNSRLMVRADVTYLKQDFSVMLPVKESGKWPTEQRFDFVVRTRRLTEDEWNEMRNTSRPFPQRDAVLYALRELTGVDASDRYEDWREIVKRYSQ